MLIKPQSFAPSEPGFSNLGRKVMSPDPPPWTESQQISQVNKDMKYKRSADEKARLPVRGQAGPRTSRLPFPTGFPATVEQAHRVGKFPESRSDRTGVVGSFFFLFFSEVKVWRDCQKTEKEPRAKLSLLKDREVVDSQWKRTFNSYLAGGMSKFSRAFVWFAVSCSRSVCGVKL